MRLAIAVIAFIVFLALSATVVKNDVPAAGGGAEAEIKVFFSADKFDAEGYVGNIWDAKVMPYIKGKAVDFATLRAAVKDDPKAAGEKYGYRAVAEHNPYNFAVKAKVKILSSNTQSKNGRAEVDVEPFDGKPDFTMLIGPVYKGTAIRDLLDFVSFDDFKNQVEFAKLATQLNLHVRDKVMPGTGILKDGGVGMVFDLYGAFTIEGGMDNPVVMPVILNPASE